MNDIYSNEVDSELNAQIIKDMNIKKPKHPETIRTVKTVKAAPEKKVVETTVVEESPVEETTTQSPVEVEIVETRTEITPEVAEDPEVKEEQPKKPAKRGRKSNKK